MSDSPPGISAAPNDDNLRHFDVTIAGPGSSPYEGESRAGTRRGDDRLNEVDGGRADGWMGVGGG